MELFREEGRVEGAIKMLCGLVKDHILTTDQAAGRAGMTVDEFKKKAKAIMAETSTVYDPA